MVRGTSIRSSISTLKKIEYSSDDIKKIQEKKPKAMLRWCYDTVPFYHRLLSEFNLNPNYDQPFNILSRLPILTKETIKANFLKLNTSRFMRKISVQTSGSSGNPLTFYQDYNTLSMGQACFYYGLSWYGYTFGDRFIRLWGGRPVASNKSQILGFLANSFMNRYDLNAHTMSDKLMLKYYNFLRKRNPKILYGYVSSLYLLAQFIEKHKMESPKIGCVVTTAEVLDQHKRNQLSSAFECDVFNQYGSTEINSLAFECPSHLCFHTMDTHAIVEVVKDDGLEVDGGEIGNMIITDLDNFQMPLLRYEIGDMAKKSSSPCSCGRGFQGLMSIEGRTSDIIIGLNGNRVHGEFFAHLLESTGIAQNSAIDQFQVVQKSNDTLVFKINSQFKLSEKTLKLLTMRLNEYLGDMTIFYEQVDGIPSHPSGKRRYTISELT